MISPESPPSNVAALQALARPGILFLCTGNYYRSRLAEEIFNHLADQKGLAHRAFSLGFTPHPHVNPGSISAFTLEALAAAGIPPRDARRVPAAVQAGDFLRYEQCIALCEREHRPMMEQMFPEHAARVRYWHVEDLAWEKPGTATAAIRVQVERLIAHCR